MEYPFPTPSSSSALAFDYYPVMNSITSGSGGGCSLLDQLSGECERSCSSLGFMEMLNMQDFGPSVFDVLQVPSVEVPLVHRHTQKQQHRQDQSYSSEVLNAPATPISSSISSDSGGGGGRQNHTDHEHQAEKEAADRDDDDDEEEEEDEGRHNKTKKQLKAKKTTGLKKQREPRFAFMTKSEIDHLEDGYRWRKYGQKAVKNSPFPRSYYRCTNTSCNVKKRVERSSNDPSIVVTTYEGQHTHPSPTMARSAGPGPYSAFSPSGGTTPFLPAPGQIDFLPPPRRQHPGHLARANCGHSMGSTNVSQQLQFCTQPPADLLTDNGLLQDLVPWSMIKKEE